MRITNHVLQFDRFDRREPDVDLPVFDRQLFEAAFARAASPFRPSPRSMLRLHHENDRGVEVGSAFDIGETAEQ